MEEFYSNKLFIHCKQAAFLETIKTMNKLTKKQQFALWFHSLICGVCKIYTKQQHAILKHLNMNGNDETNKECMCNDKKNQIQQQLLELQTSQ